MRLQMNTRRRWISVVSLAVGLPAGALVFDYFWPKTTAFYFEDCRQRDELRKRLAAAAVQFSIVESDGTSIGTQDPEEVAKKLDLPSLHQVPPNLDSTCKQ
jgi:hypothetical protein